jgi:hypothetical protein
MADSIVEEPTIFCVYAAGKRASDRIIDVITEQVPQLVVIGTPNVFTILFRIELE